MALELTILDTKARTKMATNNDEKLLREGCPKATVPMRIDPETGVAVVARTGLAPVYFIKSVPERGWNRGEVHGLSAANAKLNLANGNGMELIGVKEMLGMKEVPREEKKGRAAAQAAATA